jgi:hypothetical protein
VVLQFITEEEDDVVVMDNHWAGFIRALGEIQETKGWGGVWLSKLNSEMTYYVLDK